MVQGRRRLSSSAENFFCNFFILVHYGKPVGRVFWSFKVDQWILKLVGQIWFCPLVQWEFGRGCPVPKRTLHPRRTCQPGFVGRICPIFIMDRPKFAWSYDCSIAWTAMPIHWSSVICVKSPIFYSFCLTSCVLGARKPDPWLPQDLDKSGLWTTSITFRPLWTSLFSRIGDDWSRLGFKNMRPCRWRFSKYHCQTNG